MKRTMMTVLILMSLLMTGCAHVEWFGGNADTDTPMVKIAEIRF